MALEIGYDQDILNAKGPEADKIQAEIQQDYTRVDVYFQTLNVRSINQSPTYPVSKKYTTFCLCCYRMIPYNFYVYIIFFFIISARFIGFKRWRCT